MEKQIGLDAQKAEKDREWAYKLRPAAASGGSSGRQQTTVKEPDPVKQDPTPTDTDETKPNLSKLLSAFRQKQRKKQLPVSLSQ